MEQKLKWLEMLDGQIYAELISYYYEQAIKPSTYVSGDEELLVPSPYGDSLYSSYLQAMIAAENAESAKYNQRIVLYNSVYQQFRDYVIRSRRHSGCGRSFKF